MRLLPGLGCSSESVNGVWIPANRSRYAARLTTQPVFTSSWPARGQAIRPLE